MNPAWRQEDYLRKAEAYYHALEKEVGRKLYHKTPVVRLFATEKEREKWRNKGDEHHRWACELGNGELPFKTSQGGIEMPDGAWLDTLAFLQVVKDKLVDVGAWREGNFSEDEVVFENGLGRWQDVTAEKIILCQGAYGLAGVEKDGGWFGGVRHRCAKGEILNMWVGGLDETKRYHCDGWLAPRGGGKWKAGANYDWKNLNSIATKEGRDAVLAKLKTWLDEEKVPMEIIDWEAGVRPIIRNSRPVIGFHPKMPNVGFFNGLGSKGTLMAPAVAAHFAAYLCDECNLDEDLDIKNL